MSSKHPGTPHPPPDATSHPPPTPKPTPGPTPGPTPAPTPAPKRSPVLVLSYEGKQYEEPVGGWVRVDMAGRTNDGMNFSVPGFGLRISDVDQVMKPNEEYEAALEVTHFIHLQNSGPQKPTGRPLKTIPISRLEGGPAEFLKFEGYAWRLTREGTKVDTVEAKFVVTARKARTHSIEIGLEHFDQSGRQVSVALAGGGGEVPLTLPPAMKPSPHHQHAPGYCHLYIRLVKA